MELLSFVKLSAQRALLGNISNNVRAVAIGCQDKKLTVRYYLDRHPTQEDYDIVSDVLGEMLADFDISTFTSTSEECICDNTSIISQMNALDGWVFVRKQSNNKK